MQKTINDTIVVHYALQICDLKSFQKSQRFCGNNRTLLSKKSIRSFLNSVINCNYENNKIKHNILFLTDKISTELTIYIEHTKNIVNRQYDNINIEVHELAAPGGISNSIKYCYKWLTDNGKGLVFQIQDDYIFSQNAIFDSLDKFFQLLTEFETHAVVQPFNDCTYWYFGYRGKPTPRLVSLGKSGYWIQIYDTSCSFLTSHEQFVKHWELYDKFFKLIDHPESIKNNILENESLNHMFTQRGVLGMTPINTLSHHIQVQPDPYMDWKTIWDATDIKI